MPRIFVSQGLVDEWLGAGRVRLEGDLLHLDAGGAPMAMFINPAVYFDRIDGQDVDAYDVLGVVKSAQELAQMGAEHYETSVVLGDYAYTVIPGFLAIPVGPDGTEQILDGVGWGRLLAGLSALAPGRV
ncbi:MAG: hypothetical protein D6705_07875 [Deltaproteobacteria bacterium]|nr:MAG: hypothetical protein D6705_07875 [Deltaproteobacteria bacterium]